MNELCCLLLVLHRNHNREYDEHHDQREERHQLDVLPPHLPLQTAATDAELARAAAETIRLVDEQVDALAPLEQALDIARHDAPDIVNLALDVGDGVVFPAARGAVVDHELLELAIVAGGAVVGQLGVVCRLGGELLEEAAADLEEETKGDAAAQRGVGDNEEGEAAGGGVLWVVGGRFGDVVDVVRAVGVGQLLGGVVLDLGKDDGGEGGGLRYGRCGAFAEDGVIVRYARAVGRWYVSCVSSRGGGSSREGKAMVVYLLEQRCDGRRRRSHDDRYWGVQRI